MGTLNSALARVTSPSSVAQEVKQKIAEDPSFFRSGLKLATAGTKDCPFCTQSLTEVAQFALSKYQEYFEDAEAREKDALMSLVRDVRAAQSKVEKWRGKFLTAKLAFDELKAFFPSVQEKKTEDESAALDAIHANLEAILDSLEAKQQSLETPQEGPVNSAEIDYDEFVKIGDRNGRLFDDLASLVNNSSNERKSIQNNACGAFLSEFCNAYSSDIETIRLLTKQVETLQREIDDLRRTQGDKADARTRVAETFTILLKRFFGAKYTFDPNEFKVLREQKNMARGGDRTLSDGEKAVMAFCYFIAQCHLKVSSNEDYARLYFVFDDPVNSMSFDYVYAIVQTLKLLRIGAAGNAAFFSLICSACCSASRSVARRQQRP